MTDLSTQIAQAQPTEMRTARDLISGMEVEFAKALPASIPIERFMRVALTELRQNPDLEVCSINSLLGALMTAARLGLEVGGPRGEFYLIPRNQKGGGKAVVPIVGYQGLLRLARNAGVGLVKSYVMREGDVFSEGASSERGPFFDFKVVGDTNRKPIGALAVATYNGETTHAYLSLAQIEARRARGGAANAKFSPWISDWEAMAKKTALRELTKELPASIDSLAFVRAMDEQVQNHLPDVTHEANEVEDDTEAVEGEIIDQA